MSRNICKIIATLVLMLNHSLLFGVTEGAHIPDEEHPYGHTVHYDHAGEHLSHADHDEDDHERHHQHGLHIHLGAFLPYSISFNLQALLHNAPDEPKFLSPSLSYTPPVPPPNH